MENNTEVLGIKGKKFKLKLDRAWFVGDTDIIVVNGPRTQWYWKLLYNLTFRLFFKPRDTYKCELIN